MGPEGRDGTILCVGGSNQISGNHRRLLGRPAQELEQEAGS